MSRLWKSPYFVEVIDAHLIVIVKERMVRSRTAFVGTFFLGAAVSDEVPCAEATAAGPHLVDSRSFGMNVQFLEFGTVAKVVTCIFAEGTRWSLPRCGSGVGKIDGVALIVFLFARVFRCCGLV